MKKILVAFVVAIVGAAAAEPIIRDGVLTLELRPTDFSFTVDNGVDETEGDDAFDLALGLYGGYRHSFVAAGSRHGLVIGGGLSAGWGSYADGRIAEIGGRAEIGYAIGINDRLICMVLPFVEYGIADLSFESSGQFEGFDGSGAYLAYGVGVYASWHLSGPWTFTGGLGYRASTREIDGDNGLDFEFERSGLLVGIGMSFRFSDAPTRLD